jgi:uncharacterized protein YcbX
MQLSALHRYPLKSGRAQSLPQASISPIGLDGDRVWMLVDANGEMITGREFPKLVLVDVVADTHGATFSAAGREPLPVRTDAFVVEQDCEVWKNRFTALRGEQRADDWFSEYLGAQCSLLYIGSVPGRRHLVDEPEIPLSFADGYPLLLIGQGSLDDLNSRLARPVAMTSFRPNLVIAGADAFAEDGWRQLRIGEVLFEVAKPCTRCIFTTVDPELGQKSADREPLLTLAKYRRFKIGTCFGMNLIARSSGELRLGDSVEVLS